MARTRSVDRISADYAFHYFVVITCFNMMPYFLGRLLSTRWFMSFYLVNQWRNAVELYPYQRATLCGRVAYAAPLYYKKRQLYKALATFLLHFLRLVSDRPISRCLYSKITWSLYSSEYSWQKCAPIWSPGKRNAETRKWEFVKLFNLRWQATPL